MTEKQFYFKRNLFQRKCMTVKTCKIELLPLLMEVLPLLRKPTRKPQLAFETGLMFSSRYGLGDGELQVSFRESLTLSLVVGVHPYVISGQPDTKRAFLGRLT